MEGWVYSLRDGKLVTGLRERVKPENLGSHTSLVTYGLNTLEKLPQPSVSQFLHVEKVGEITGLGR